MKIASYLTKEQKLKYILSYGWFGDDVSGYYDENVTVKAACCVEIAFSIQVSRNIERIVNK